MPYSDYEKRKQRSREYYRENRDEILRKKRKKYKENPQKYLERTKEWRKQIKGTDRWNELMEKGKERRRKTIESAILELGGECMMCGWSIYPFLLHLHHKTPIRRKYLDMGMGRSRLLRKDTDLTKYELLCPICHAITHAKTDNPHLLTKLGGGDWR